MLLTNSGGVPSVDAERIEVLMQRQVDGLIVLPALEDDPATLAALRAMGNTKSPVVLIDRAFSADIRAHYVLSITIRASAMRRVICSSAGIGASVWWSVAMCGPRASVFARWKMRSIRWASRAI